LKRYSVSTRRNKGWNTTMKKYVMTKHNNMTITYIILCLFLFLYSLSYWLYQCTIIWHFLTINPRRHHRRVSYRAYLPTKITDSISAIYRRSIGSILCSCPFVLFLLAIGLSVLLRYTDSDFPFGIFKLFLMICYRSSLHFIPVQWFWSNLWSLDWNFAKYLVVTTEACKCFTLF
jgi:hypothetical protein